MQQTRKGNQWPFGMKLHMGVDAQKGRRLARDELERLMEACKSSVKGKVEHMFFYVRPMFG